MPIQTRKKVKSAAQLQDREAERRVIAGLIRSPELTVKHVVDILRSKDFAYAHHAWLFRTCVSHWQYLRVTPVPLDDLFIRASKTGTLNWPIVPWETANELVTIWDACPTGISAVWSAKRVKELSARRRVIHEANETIREALEEPIEYAID